MSELNWKTEKRKISELVVHPHNPRQLSDSQVAELTASLTKFNLAEIPAINLDNMILAGHMRLRIMSMVGRGEEEIDVRVPNRLLDDDERDEYLIRSNKNTGGWDWDSLANNFDRDKLEEWGFTPFELGEWEDDQDGEGETDDIVGSDSPAETVIKVSCTEANKDEVIEAVETAIGGIVGAELI